MRVRVTWRAARARLVGGREVSAQGAQGRSVEHAAEHRAALEQAQEEKQAREVEKYAVMQQRLASAAERHEAGKSEARQRNQYAAAALTAGFRCESWKLWKAQEAAAAPPRTSATCVSSNEAAARSSARPIAVAAARRLAII